MKKNNTHFRIYFTLPLFLFFLNSSYLVFAQTNIVAQLTGNPIDTNGWNFIGDGGGGYVDLDEFILTQDAVTQKGAIYYNEPYNLNVCKKWRVEFDYLMYGMGTPTYGNADGIAFWYLENPPTDFQDGGGIGIPIDGIGIMVVMDTFDNSTEGAQSELQVLYGQGYHEQNNATNMYFFNTMDGTDHTPIDVRSPDENFKHCVITWSDGLLTVSINGIQICSFTPTPHDGAENIIQGYFGFSGSTGAGTDWHIIKNAFVYMDIVEVEDDSIEMYACDPYGDGFSEFDLTSQNETIISNSTNYTIEFYEDEFLTDQVTNPTNFTNTTAFNQTIYVKINNGEDCYDTAEIHLHTNSLPSQNTIPTQTFCDDDGDGQETVNLINYQSQFINGDLSDLVFHYYTDAALTNEIPQTDWANYLITAFPHHIWILAEKTFSPGGICATEPYEIIFDLGANLPTNGDEFALNNTPICHEPGQSVPIDLTQSEPIITNETGVSFTYYETETQANIGGTDFISNPNSYPANNSGSVFVRLSKSGFCIQVVQLNFILAEYPEAQPSINLGPLCDDDFDGFVNFDLDAQAIPELVTDPTGLTFTYYLSQSDAQNQLNPQSSSVNVPTGQMKTIWVVIANASCEVISKIHLVASEGITGLALTVNPIEICDDDFDGAFQVDLTQVESLYLSNPSQYTFSYYEDNSLSQQLPTNQIQNYVVTSSPTEIWVVINNGECSATRNFEVIINPEVPYNSSSLSLTNGCEGDLLDLTEVIPQISNDSGITYQFFISQQNAFTSQNPISDPSAYSTENTSGTVYIRLEKNGYCPVVLTMTYEMNPAPVNPIDEVPEICQGEEIMLDAGNVYPEQNYNWEWDGGQQTGPIITIDEAGIYTLTITTDLGCEKEFEISVEERGIPEITNITIGENYIIVEAIGSGAPLEYSLDGILWQSDPKFDNLIAGQEYTVYVRESGCTPVKKKVILLLIPNFISPNGDGYNDIWAIRGIDATPSATIKIFDRYGKVFVDTNFEGDYVWNGIYEGRPLPTGDYWYILHIPKDDIMPKQEFIGHISVKNY